MRSFFNLEGYSAVDLLKSLYETQEFSVCSLLSELKVTLNLPTLLLSFPFRAKVDGFLGL